MPEQKITPGQALAAMREIVDHNCPSCGGEFQGIKKAVYCSEACKQKAKYQRQKEKPPKAQPRGASPKQKPRKG